MNDFDKKLDFDSNTFENREIHRPRNLTRKSRRILPTTSWAMQTQKVTITKIRRSRYGTGETKSE